jgi:hypothetical protein
LLLICNTTQDGIHDAPTIPTHQYAGCSLKTHIQIRNTDPVISFEQTCGEFLHLENDNAIEPGIGEGTKCFPIFENVYPATYCPTRE